MNCVRSREFSRVQSTIEVSIAPSRISPPPFLNLSAEFSGMSGSEPSRAQGRSTKPPLAFWMSSPPNGFAPESILPFTAIAFSILSPRSSLSGLCVTRRRQRSAFKSKLRKWSRVGSSAPPRSINSSFAITSSRITISGISAAMM